MFRRFRSPAWVALAVALTAPVSAVTSSSVTGAKANVKNLTPVPGGVNGVGSICVYVDVDGAPIPKPAGTSKCSVTVPADSYTTPKTEQQGLVAGTYTGWGQDKAKFAAPAGSPVVGQSDFLANETSGTNPTGTTTAKAHGFWAASITPAGDTSVRLRTAASVDEPAGLASLQGHAAAEAKDPISFEFDASGSFDFTFELGDPLLFDLDGEQLPSLALSSDNPHSGVAAFIRVGLNGVSYAGQDLDGDLFTLIIGGEGIIGSVDDLFAEFVPWTGLGLSTTDILAVEDYVLDALVPLATGGFGLPAGTEIPLIGPGGPIDTLTFDHGVGEVELHASAISAATTVAQPATPLLLLMGCLGWYCRRLTGRTVLV